MIRSSLLVLVFFLVVAAHAAAKAQPIQSEPLAPFKPYTMSTETDPMAMDPGTMAPAPTINRSTAVEAPPPPGQDDHPAATPRNERQMESVAPSVTVTPVPAMTTNTGTGMTGPMPDYPNNNVSGVIPQDERKFQNKVFCTIEISFGSACCGPDSKTADKVKSYLDANSDKLTYIKSSWGKEGEFSYCLDIPQHNYRGNIYTSLKKILPPQTNSTAPTTISGKGFAPVNTSEEK